MAIGAVSRRDAMSAGLARAPQRGDGQSGPRPLPTAETGLRTARDPWTTERIWRPWTLCVTDEAPASHRFRRRYLETPGVALYRDHFGTACRLRGLVPPGRVAILVPLSVGGRCRGWGRPLGRGCLPALLSGGIDWVFDDGHGHLLVLIERSLLRRHCDPDLRAALEGIADAGFIPVRPGAVADFARWLKQAVEDANGRPEALAHPGATARWEAQLLTQLGDTLDEARAVRGKSVYSARRQGMDRALEHLRLAQPSAVKMTRLAEVAGVSQRTLEYGFRDLFGLTPIGFQQLLRLHAARRELAAAERGCIRIGEVADRHGFPQHGRFAVNYRDLFGESPSATLRRPGARVPADGASAVRG